MKARFLLLLGLLIIGLLFTEACAPACMTREQIDKSGKYAYRVDIRPHGSPGWQVFWCQSAESFTTANGTNGVILRDCTGGSYLSYSWPKGVEPEVKITKLGE